MDEQTNNESVTPSDDFFENQIFLENEFPFDANAFPVVEQFAESVVPDPSIVKNEVLEEPMAEEQPISEQPIADEAVTQPIPQEEAVAEPEPEQQFTVEAIVGKRRRGGRAEYQVKWLGFDDSENTWEPIDNLNCQVSAGLAVDWIRINALLNRN